MRAGSSSAYFHVTLPPASVTFFVTVRGNLLEKLQGTAVLVTHITSGRVVNLCEDTVYPGCHTVNHLVELRLHIHHNGLGNTVVIVVYVGVIGSVVASCQKQRFQSADIRIQGRGDRLV